MRPFAVLLLATASLLVAPPAVPAEPFTANGLVVGDFLGCTIFQDLEHPGLYLLDDYGTFQSGDYVTVAGEVEYCSSGCEIIHECVQVASITAWPPNFAGCGVIEETEICWYFRTEDHVYLLDTCGEFVPGDEIYVLGHIVYDYIDYCMEGIEEAGIFLDAAIIPCAASSVDEPARTPSRWSTVKARFR